MKRDFLHIILITALVLIIKPMSYSQGFSIGGKIGMGLSTLSNWEYRSSGIENRERSSLVGLQVSVFGKYKFNDLLGLQAELQYIQKGENKEYKGATPTIKGKVTTSYLTIPILLNINHSFDKINIYGNLGPYLGLGLSAKESVKEPIKSSQEMKFTEGVLRRFDMGLCIGAGAGYRLGPGDIILDIRYDLGLMDTYSTPDEDKGSNYKATKNRTFGISVGYVIPLGQE